NQRKDAQWDCRQHQETATYNLRRQDLQNDGAPTLEGSGPGVDGGSERPQANQPLCDRWEAQSSTDWRGGLWDEQVPGFLRQVASQQAHPCASRGSALDCC